MCETNRSLQTHMDCGMVYVVTEIMEYDMTLFYVLLCKLVRVKVGFY